MSSSLRILPDLQQRYCRVLQNARPVATKVRETRRVPNLSLACQAEYNRGDHSVYPRVQSRFSATLFGSAARRKMPVDSKWTRKMFPWTFSFFSVAKAMPSSLSGSAAEISY